MISEIVRIYRQETHVFSSLGWKNPHEAKSNPASCAMPSPIECAFATLYPWQQVDKLTKIHKYVAGAACSFTKLRSVGLNVGLKNPLAKCTDHIGPLHVVPLGISESTCYRGQCSVFRELSTPTIQFQARQFPTPDADLFPLTLMRWLEVIPVIITPPSTNRGWGKSCKLIASVSEFKLRCPLHFWLRASLSCQLWYFSNQKTAIWCQINIHKPISGSHSPLESRVSRFLRIVVAAAPCQAAPCHPISHLHLLSKTALLRGCQCLFAQRHGKLWRMERVKNLGIANI